MTKDIFLLKRIRVGNKGVGPLFEGSECFFDGSVQGSDQKRVGQRSFLGRRRTLFGSDLNF